MKIYSGGGDKGKTSLYSGERIAKSHPYLEAGGDVDELNSVIGAIMALLPPDCSHVLSELRQIQSNLMKIGASLSVVQDTSAVDKVPKLFDSDVKTLECAIDSLQNDLPVLTGFILPSGHMSAAMTHIARTICRRAERHVVAVSLQTGLDDVPHHLTYQLIYLNRLSDYLFTLARYCNHVTGVGDQYWKP